jgi:hypothetical protein
MGKYYSQYRRPPRPERKWRVHPIWRGIGCIMLVVIPLVSWALAGIFVEANREGKWLDVPSGLSNQFISSDLVVTLLVTLVIAILLFGAYSIFYMLIYRLFGPPALGPLDAPPEKRRVSKRRRATR